MGRLSSRDLLRQGNESFLFILSQAAWKKNQGQYGSQSNDFYGGGQYGQNQFGI